MIQDLIVPNKTRKKNQYKLKLEKIKNTGFNTYFNLQV